MIGMGLLRLNRLLAKHNWHRKEAMKRKKRKRKIAGKARSRLDWF